MLIGIDPLLTPELLMHLSAMGHGEWVAVVDANFTADFLGMCATPRPRTAPPRKTLWSRWPCRRVVLRTGSNRWSVLRFTSASRPPA
ncbi:MAG: hypothetical protein EBX37_13210 [Alphaproteobacteria bacterium]|nr:hypothetical protein [Alphaproteobacteria bacterium]